MNCDRFEMLARDLSRDRLLDDPDRAAAVEHAARCPRCSCRLRDERALSAGLRALAAPEAHAPERVEQALRSAFREGAAAPIGTSMKARRLRIGVGMAAAVLLPLLAAFWFVPGGRAPVEGQQKGGPRPETSAAAPQHAPAEPVLGESRPPAVEQLERPRKPRSRPSVAAPREVATRFFPLTHGGDLSQLESGQIVRVRMPRIVLASFGLPVNFERSGEPVSADVIVGYDGIARAIRFVQ